MLANQTAIVTGGAKGIGAAVSLALAQAGVNIVLNYRSEVNPDLIKKIEGYGVRCLPVQADISQFEEAKRIVDETLETFGKIDILVNNAGITKDKLLMGMTEEDFDQVVSVNLKGAFHMIRHVFKPMTKQKSGAIINMSSVVGLTGNVGQANYAASKAGLIGLTKSAAKEFGMKGVTVNAIAPGFIDTDMAQGLSDKIKEDILKSIPLKRMGRPEEIGDAVVFLAQQKYITGQVLCIDGGLHT